MHRGQLLQFPLVSPQEIAGGPRIGGRLTRQGSQPVWDGRPPIVRPEVPGPQTLAMAYTPPAADPGRTVTVELTCANGFGGRVFRRFCVGAGLTAEIRCGTFALVKAIVPNPGVPAESTFFFSWSYDLVGGHPLYWFDNVAGGAAIVNFPEGTTHVIPELACQITFQAPQFASTFVYNAAAGERVPAIWGAATFNVGTSVIYEMKGL